MTPQEEAKLKEVIDKVQALPEGAEIPNEILAELTTEQIYAVLVEQMMSEKGVEPTDELRAELRGKLSDEVTKALVLAMPEYLVKELNEKIDNGADDNVVDKAINESGIDVETITEQTVKAFREKYLNGEVK